MIGFQPKWRIPVNSSTDVTILGSGISGMSCAYHLDLSGVTVEVIEKDATYGGLCGNFTVKGYRFDRFVHFSFANNEYTREILECGNEMYHHKPESSNFSDGTWLRHPVQNNLFPLPLDEKLNIIKGFIEDRNKYIKPENYEEWLKMQYGDYFSENYPMKYTEKYWTVPARKLGVEWVGNRMHKPSLDEVLKGAMAANKEINYYTKEMRYPKKGGYKSVLNKLKSNMDITYNKQVMSIDVSSKSISFKDGTIKNYTKLVSSIPLNQMPSIIIDTPKNVKNAAEKLLCTGGYLVYFGFNKPDIAKKLWFYIYDKDIYPSRVFSPSLKSPDNAPVGASSLMAEVYFSKELEIKLSEDQLKEHVKDKMIAMGLFKNEDIEIYGIKKEPYANVVFTHEIYENRKIVRDYVENKCGIEIVGRFGEWDYFWSDQSFESGQRVAGQIIKSKK